MQTISAIFRKIRPISLVEKLIFTKNLGVMLGSGLPMVTTLDILARQTENQKFQKIIKDIQKNMRSGNTLTDSMAKHPEIFSGLYINMVKVGEEGGTLETVLNGLAEQIKKEHTLRAKISGAFIYPAIVLSTMAIIGVIMMIFIVPRLLNVFQQFNVALPWTTQVIINVSLYFSRYGWLILIALTIGLVLLKKYSKTKAGQKIAYQILFRLPILGKMNHQLNSALFARNLSSLITSGVHITKSLTTTAGTIKNPYYRESLILAAKEVSKGEALYKIVERWPKLYPPFVRQILEVGEETGQLAKLLEHLAEFYEEEVDQTTADLSITVEPALMILIGLAVGFFAISMLQPMYSILQSV